MNRIPCTVTAIVIAVGLAAAAPALASAPRSASPGAEERVLAIEGRCPTFAWEASPGALFSQLVVYRLADHNDLDAPLGPDHEALYAEVPGAVGAWTPPSEQCLAPGGRYAWFVRTVHELAGDQIATASDWSTPRYFAVPDSPSAEEMRRALEVLRRWDEATAGGSPLPTAAVAAPVAAPAAAPVAAPAPAPTTSKSVPTASAAIRGLNPALAGEAYGVVGVTSSYDGAGLAAANLDGGPDLVLDGSADGVADTRLSQSGIDRPSPSPQTFSVANSGGGGLTLDVQGGVAATALDCPGCVASTDLAAGAVTTTRLANAAVTSAKLADGSVTGAAVEDGAIGAAHLRPDAVSSATLQDGAVTGAKIASGAVTSTKIAANAVTSGAIVDGTVTTADLADDAVTVDKLAFGAVESDRIRDGAVTTDKITPGAVTSAALATGAVTAAKILNGAVENRKLADEAVTETKIAADAVTADKIARDAVGSSQIASGAVGINQLASASVTSPKILDGAVTKSKIAAAGGTSGQVLSTDGSALGWADAGTGDITSVVAGGGLSGGGDSGDVTLSIGTPPGSGVTTNMLWDSAVTNAKIADGAVDAWKIAPGSITTNRIVDGAITNAKVADGAITAAKVDPLGGVYSSKEAIYKKTDIRYLPPLHYDYFSAYCDDVNDLPLYALTVLYNFGPWDCKLLY